MVTGCRSTSARAVTISQTYSPLTVPTLACSRGDRKRGGAGRSGSPRIEPNSRHNVRNATFVTPAIGASTTGLTSAIGPMRNAGYRRLIVSLPSVLCSS